MFSENQCPCLIRLIARMTHLYLADSLVTFLVASPLYLVTLLVTGPVLVHSGAVPIPVHIDDEYIAKFYQYGYQVEDTYTGKHTYS